MKLISENWKNVNDKTSLANFIKEFATYLVTGGYCGFPRVSKTTIDINQAVQKSLAERSVVLEDKGSKYLIGLVEAVAAFGIGFACESKLQVVQSTGTDLLQSVLTTEVMAHYIVVSVIKNTPLITGLVCGLAVAAWAYQQGLFERPTRDLASNVKEDEQKSGESQKQGENETRDTSDNTDTSKDQQKQQQQQTQVRKANSVADIRKLFQIESTNLGTSMREPKSTKNQSTTPRSNSSGVTRSSTAITTASTPVSSVNVIGKIQESAAFASIRNHFDNQGINVPQISNNQQPITNSQQSTKEIKVNKNTTPTPSNTTSSQFSLTVEEKRMDLREEKFENLQLKETFTEKVVVLDQQLTEGQNQDPEVSVPVVTQNIDDSIAPTIEQDDLVSTYENRDQDAEKSEEIDDMPKDLPPIYQVPNTVEQKIEQTIKKIPQSNSLPKLNQEVLAKIVMLKEKENPNSNTQILSNYVGPYKEQVQAIETKIIELEFDLEDAVTEKWISFVSQLIYGKLLLEEAEKILTSEGKALPTDLLLPLSSLISSMKFKLNEEKNHTDDMVTKCESKKKNKLKSFVSNIVGKK